MTDRPQLPHDPAKVKAELQRRILDVLAWSGIPDQPRGGLVTPLNPRRNDRRPGSFVIWATTGTPGAWKDYALSDVGGDVWDLIVYLNRLNAWIDAYWWALDRLNWGRGEVRTQAQDAQERQRWEEERQARAAKEAAERRKVSRALKGLWLSLPKDLTGTPADRYLREVRGLPMGRLPYPPGALRWCAEAEFIEPDTGEVKTWRSCMVAAVTIGSEVTGLHRTFLLPDGSGKAPGKAKMMKGTTAGGAIRLAKGAGGLTPAEAEKRGRSCPLILGEGIETVLTCAIARPDYRAWAAGSLDHMGLIDWPACASAVVLLKDNDWKPEAMAAFERVTAHWQRQANGRPLTVVSSTAGSDFNDMVRGKG